ncbi:MAG: sulfatase [Planctomycetes bacterium]|nr:sulfatase [Planctomycetota bacterium]
MALVLIMPACPDSELIKNEQHRPNFILISLDDLGADHLGCYGYDRSTSPFIDSLAQRGTLFESAVAQDTWTLPSHVSMLTSRHVGAHLVTKRDSRLPAKNLNLLQETFQAGKYHTAAFTTCSFVSPSYGFDRGFDHFFYQYAPAPEMNPEISAYLASKKFRQPFFLFLHFYDVHSPFDKKNPYGEDFGDLESTNITEIMWKLRELEGQRITDITQEQRDWLHVAFPEELDLQTVLDSEELQDLVITEKLLKNLASFYLQSLDPEAIKSLQGAYDNGVAFMDKNLSELFADLRTFPWYDDTVIVITSDHGEAFNQHPGLFGHGGPPFRELSDIPLIFIGPGVPSGLRITNPVASIDIAPTLLSLAGLPLPQDFQGVSLCPLLQGEPFLDRPILSGSEATGRASWQEDSWKLIVSLKTDQYWLYDLNSGKSEINDLSESHPDRYNILWNRFQRAEKQNSELGERIQQEKTKLTIEEESRLRKLGYFD